MPASNTETAFDFDTIHAIELEARRLRAETMAALFRSMLRGLFTRHGAGRTA